MGKAKGRAWEAGRGRGLGRAEQAKSKDRSPTGGCTMAKEKL